MCTCSSSGRWTSDAWRPVPSVERRPLCFFKRVPNECRKACTSIVRPTLVAFVDPPLAMNPFRSGDAGSHQISIQNLHQLVRTLNSSDSDGNRGTPVIGRHNRPSDSLDSLTLRLPPSIDLWFKMNLSACSQQLPESNLPYLQAIVEGIASARSAQSGIADPSRFFYVGCS